MVSSSSAAPLTGSPAAPAAPAADSEHAALSSCPIIPVVEMVFSRWTTPVLWVLQQHGPLRFTDLRRHLAPITAKVLTQRVRQLERDGLVRRASAGGVPPRSSYTITQLGLSLTPAFRELASWSTSNSSAVEQARRHYDRAGRPRPA